MRTLFAAALTLSMAAGPVSAQEAPKVEEPKLPDAPKLPEVPGGGDKPAAAPAPRVPMRKVLDHKKQFVVYPRVGYMKVLGSGEDPGIGHITMGGEAQIAFKRKFYASLESHLLYISDGTYGLTFEPSRTSVYRYDAEQFTSMTGVGFGMFTGLLDKQELWTHFGLKAGYLHPFFVPIWLSGDIEKEFRRTRSSYFTLSMAPMLGVLIPLRSPVTQQNYAFDPEEEGAQPPAGGSVRFFAGAQLSIAFVFAPRS